MTRKAMLVLLVVLATSRAIAAQDSFAVAAPPGASSVAARAGEPVTVAVSLHIDRSIKSRRIREGLKDEAASLWRPYGIRLEWREAAASDAAFHGVTLSASLDRDRERAQNLEWRPILGHVEVRPDMPRRRSVHVSFDAVEAVLALRTNVGLALKGIVLERDLAVALGRVLAHEIGHVLLGPPYHDPAGLMRASIPPNELAQAVRTPFHLTCSGVERLRRRFGPSIAEPPCVACIAIQPTSPRP